MISGDQISNIDMNIVSFLRETNVNISYTWIEVSMWTQSI